MAVVALLLCSSQGACAPLGTHLMCTLCCHQPSWRCKHSGAVSGSGSTALGHGQAVLCSELSHPAHLGLLELWEGTGLAVCSGSAWGALLGWASSAQGPACRGSCSLTLCPFPLPLAVDKEEAALLHEEATMTIEELLTRYGQNCTKNLKAKSVAAAGDSAVEGTGKQHDGESNMNGEAAPGELPDHKERKNGKPDEEITGISSTSDKASAGGNSPALQKPELGKGDEAVTSSTGEAGPSCSSTGKPQRTTKSKFFEDSEDESDEVEEEEEDSEVGNSTGTEWPSGWAQCIAYGGT